MILNKLTLRNCGTFNDGTYVFHKGLNAIYGENESGKTTTAQTIPDILFGKPEKDMYSLVHSSDQMEIECDITEENEAYRFVQKSATFGQKSLERGAEKKYDGRKLFADYFIPKGIDKTFFQSAFRLNANELQNSRENFAKETGKINAILFDAMGSETFSDLPSILNTEADTLFSPNRNAKTKVINKIVIEIEVLKNEIKEYTLSSGKYATQLKDIKRHEKKISSLKEQLIKLQTKRDNTLLKLQSNADKFFDYVDIRSKTDSIQSDSLPPEHKIENIETLLKSLEQNTVLLGELKERISQAKIEQGSIVLDEKVLEYADSIHHIQENSQLYIDKKHSLNTAITNLDHVSNKIQEEILDLNLLPSKGSISPEDLKTLVQSTELEKDLKSFVTQFQEHLYSNIPFSVDEVRAQQLMTSLDALRNDYENNKTSLVDLANKITLKETEINNITVGADFSSLSEARQKRTIAWGNLTENIQEITSREDEKVKTFIHQEQSLDNTVDMLIQDSKNVGQKDALQKELIGLIQRREEITASQQSIREKGEAQKEKWKIFFTDELHVADLRSQGFQNWNDKRKAIVSQIKEKETLEKQIEQYSLYIQTYEKEVANLGTTFEISEDTESTLKLLYAKLRTANESRISQENSLAKLTQDESVLKIRLEEQDRQTKELHNLLPEALKNKDHHFILNEVDNIKKKYALLHKKDDLHKSLLSVFGDDFNHYFEGYGNKRSIEDHYQKVKVEIDEKTTELDEFEDNKRSLEEELKDELQSDESILYKHQELESKKLALKEEIDRYLNLRISGLAISKANAALSAESAKELIARAGKYFEIITGGDYTDLRINGDFFVTKRKQSVSSPEKGKIESLYIDDEYIEVTDSKMSEGTKDQLFLSLRLAFISIFNENSDKKLPFIADDILINFDDNRIKNALKLLLEFAESTQIFFFTHNSRVMEILHELEQS